MDALELKLCDIQGRLFELSLAKGYDSEKFVSAFMTSDVAKHLDSEYNRLQWAGAWLQLHPCGIPETHPETKLRGVQD